MDHSSAIFARVVYIRGGMAYSLESICDQGSFEKALGTCLTVFISLVHDECKFCAVPAALVGTGAE